MKYYWFGGSWVYGDELTVIAPGTSRADYAFPYLVSRNFNADCINLAGRGDSIDCTLLNFYKIIPDLTLDSVIFFCLPTIHRVSFFDENGNLKNILPNGYKNTHNMHDYSNEWYKYFDTIPQRIYHQNCMVNLLHFWCTNLKVRHWFFYDSYTQIENMMDVTPEEIWLLPRHQCLTQLILPLVNEKTKQVILHDEPLLTTQEWETQKPYIEKYIRPCYAHPNIEGHKEISEKLINLLIERSSQ